MESTQNFGEETSWEMSIWTAENVRIILKYEEDRRYVHGISIVPNGNQWC